MVSQQVYCNPFYPCPCPCPCHHSLIRFCLFQATVTSAPVTRTESLLLTMLYNAMCVVFRSFPSAYCVSSCRISRNLLVPLAAVLQITQDNVMQVSRKENNEVGCCLFSLIYRPWPDIQSSLYVSLRHVAVSTECRPLGNFEALTRGMFPWACCKVVCLFAFLFA